MASAIEPAIPPSRWWLSLAMMFALPGCKLSSEKVEVCKPLPRSLLLVADRRFEVSGDSKEGEELLITPDQPTVDPSYPGYGIPICQRSSSPLPTRRVEITSSDPFEKRMSVQSVTIIKPAQFAKGIVNARYFDDSNLEDILKTIHIFTRYRNVTAYSFQIGREPRRLSIECFRYDKDRNGDILDACRSSVRMSPILAVTHSIALRNAAPRDLLEGVIASQRRLDRLLRSFANSR